VSEIVPIEERGEKFGLFNRATSDAGWRYFSRNPEGRGHLLADCVVNR